MINAILFFDLPSGGYFHLEAPARLPLSEYVKVFSNKPRLIVGFGKDEMFYWFGDKWDASSMLFLIQQTAGNIKEINLLQ